jgi:hypothetical protein
MKPHDNPQEEIAKSEPESPKPSHGAGTVKDPQEAAKSLSLSPKKAEK